MSYEVTATRKRPRNFQELLGQDFVVGTLTNAIQSGRIAHAYLFAGPRGVGKTSAARVLARALNHPGKPSIEDLDWDGAEEIARGRSIDVIEIDGASNTSVNDVRAIKDEVLFPPQGSNYKIYIIDEVHMLSNSAFNALLKTIEEPPPYIIFIFATTEVHKVPATIRSRCQHFNFRLIPTENIVERLRDAARDLSLEAEEQALLWIAKEASGSMRDAYTLFDQIAAFSRDIIKMDAIREKLGIAGHDRISRLLESCCDSVCHQALAESQNLISAGIPVEQIIIEMAEYFRSILFIKAGIKTPSILGAPLEDFSRRIVETFSQIQVEKGLGLILDSYRSLRYTIEPAFELDLLISRLSHLKSYLDPEEIYAKLLSSRSTSIQAKEIEPKVEIASVQKPILKPKYEKSDFDDLKRKILDDLTETRPILVSPLASSTFQGEQAGKLVIETENEYSKNLLARDSEMILSLVKKSVASVHELEIVLKKAELANHVDTIGTNPDVELVKEIFRGEIVTP